MQIFTTQVPIEQLDALIVVSLHGMVNQFILKSKQKTDGGIVLELASSTYHLVHLTPSLIGRKRQILPFDRNDILENRAT